VSQLRTSCPGVGGFLGRSHLAVRAVGRCVPGMTTLALTIALMAAFAAPAWADRPLGIDVSSWCPLTQSEWNAVHNSGRTFAFARASYGWGYPDSEFVNHTTRGVNAGMIMGAYHYSYPGYSSGNTPINEANTFLSAAGSYLVDGYLRPVLDVEYVPGPYMGGLTLTQWCNQWMDYVEAQTGVEPLVYTGAYFAQAHLNSSITSRDLWIAAWPANPNPQTDNPAYLWLWSTWCFWQYAGDVAIPGVTTKKVDLNVFNGTPTGLQAFVISTQPPTITEHPSPQHVFPGGTATFTVSATGSSPLSYRWQKNSVNLNNGGHYSGVTTTTLTISNADNGDEANYRCRVTNYSGQATSNAAALTVAIPGDLDDDGDIDLADFGAFQVCLTGSGNPQNDPNCEAAKLEGGDDDIDDQDIAKFLGCLSGAGIPGNQNCLD